MVTALKTDSQLESRRKIVETGVPSTGSGQEGEEAPGSNMVTEGRSREQKR